MLVILNLQTKLWLLLTIVGLKVRDSGPKTYPVFGIGVDLGCGLVDSHAHHSHHVTH